MLDFTDIYANKEALEALKELDEKPEVVIHKNTQDALRNLANEGYINLLYTPVNPEFCFVVPKGEPDLHVDFVEDPDGKSATVIYKEPGVTQNLQRQYEGMPKYLIPIDRIDEIFDMIDNGCEPDNIVKRLQS